jgi:DNA polymerase I
LNSVATRHDVGSIASKYLGLTTGQLEDVCGRGAKQIRFDQVDLENAPPPCGRGRGRDAARTSAVAAAAGIPSSSGSIPSSSSRSHGCCTMEQPASWSTPRCCIGRAASSRSDGGTETAAHTLAGGPFNIGSPKQLQEVLYERLALPVLGKTPKGQPSTAESVLQSSRRTTSCRADPRLPRAREAEVDLHRQAAARDQSADRPHPHVYHQAVAATGRLSSSIRTCRTFRFGTPEGRRIRQAFIAPPGYAARAADYSQIELRIMAHLSGDAGLVGRFADRRTSTAQPPRKSSASRSDDVTTISAARQGDQLRADLRHVRIRARASARHRAWRGAAYIDLYFERYPGVKRYMDETRELARNAGYVSTVFGGGCTCPRSTSATRSGANTRSAARSMPRCRVRPPTSSSARCSKSPWLEEPSAEDAPTHHAGARRARARGARRPGRTRGRRGRALMESRGRARVPLQVDCRASAPTGTRPISGGRSPGRTPERSPASLRLGTFRNVF